jgi:hypothetical protein
MEQLAGILKFALAARMLMLIARDFRQQEACKLAFVVPDLLFLFELNVNSSNF